MSDGLYLQAMDNASDTSGMAQDAHKGQRREIFVCVLVHLGWTVAALGCAMGTAELGVWRWLLPATLLLLGLLQALLAWLVQGGADHAGGGEAPARARVDGFTTPHKGADTNAGGKRAGSGPVHRDVAGQLLRNLHVLTLAASVLDLPVLLGGNSRKDHGYDLARDSKHRDKRLAIFLTRRPAHATCNPTPPRLQPHTAQAATPTPPGLQPEACVCVSVCVCRLALACCAAASLLASWSVARAALLGSLLLLDSVAASPRLCRHFQLGFLCPAGQDHLPQYLIRSIPDEVLLPLQPLP